MNIRTILPVIFFIVATLPASAQKNNNEQEAIHKAIDQESKTFFEHRFDQWASTWVHDSTAFRINTYRQGYDKTTGWNKISNDIKEYMKTATLLSAEERLQYSNKFDYQYCINGNLATVFFKEGKTKADANDEMRLMIKQNGEWKIAGILINSTGSDNFRTSVERLRLFIGKWKIVEGSYVSKDSLFHMIAYTFDIHEIINGIEFSSAEAYRYDKNPYQSTVNEQFIPDYGINKIRYSYSVRSTMDYVFGGNGTALFDSSGNFVITELWENTSLVSTTNTYTLKDDETLHFDGKSFNKEGKQTDNWSFDLKRL